MNALLYMRTYMSPCICMYIIYLCFYLYAYIKNIIIANHSAILFTLFKKKKRLIFTDSSSYHLLICLLSEIVKFLIKLQLYTKNSKD